MNKFEKQLEKWNNGVLRGAQAKLAKCLRVTTATVALWATGKRHPSKGYVAQMARLFTTDEHSVEQLFISHPAVPPSGFAPMRATATSWVLHDADDEENCPNYINPHDTVALPVFTQLPPTYPQFAPQQVHAWWRVPRSTAHHLSFLFLLPNRNDPERLLFVHYSPSWQKGKIMLIKHETKYQLAYVREIKPRLVLQPVEKSTVFSRALPVGVVSREICKMQFTP